MSKRDKDKEKSREKEKDKEKDRDKDKEKERDKDKDKDKDKEKDALIYPYAPPNKQLGVAWSTVRMLPFRSEVRLPTGRILADASDLKSELEVKSKTLEDRIQAIQVASNGKPVPAGADFTLKKVSSFANRVKQVHSTGEYDSLVRGLPIFHVLYCVTMSLLLYCLFAADIDPRFYWAYPLLYHSVHWLGLLYL